MSLLHQVESLNREAREDRRRTMELWRECMLEKHATSMVDLRNENLARRIDRADRLTTASIAVSVLAIVVAVVLNVAYPLAIACFNR